MSQKKEYVVYNWSDYTESLTKRGDIHLWIDQQVIDNWYVKPEKNSSVFGRVYSDDCIRSVSYTHLTLPTICSV